MIENIKQIFSQCLHLETCWIGSEICNHLIKLLICKSKVLLVILFSALFYRLTIEVNFVKECVTVDE